MTVADVTAALERCWQAAQSSGRDAVVPVHVLGEAVYRLRSSVRSSKLRIIVSGGRSFGTRPEERALFERVTDELTPDTGLVVHGNYNGADELADEWASKHGLPCFRVPARWQYFGRKAGPIRNGWMLEHAHADLVLAFPGHRGTADTVKQARELGLPVHVVEP